MKLPQINIKKMKGFGLVEVLIATVVLGVGIVGVANFQGNVYKDGSVSKQRAEALKLAEEKLEELRHFSTAIDYEQQITSNLSGVDNIADVTVDDRKTAIYSLKAYATPDNTGRSANLSVQITWPDLGAGGDITPNTTIRLSTVISNTVPSTLVMTPIAPAPLPSKDTDPPPDVKVEDPDDTDDLTSDNPEACACQTITASLEPGLINSDGFVKVMGSMGGMDRSSSTTTTTTTLTNEYCDICCDYALPGTEQASLSNNEQYYADFKNKLNEFMNSEMENYKNTAMEDQSIAESQFNPAYLVKGYQSADNLYEKFLQKTMKNKNSNQTTTATQWALCSFVTVTTTSGSRTRGCKVWASSN